MSLRRTLGADADHVHEQLSVLLDSEDAMIVLVDGSRAISYAHGFGLSPSQLELLALEIERAVRSVAGPPSDQRRIRRNYGEARVNITDSGRGAGLRRELAGRGSTGAVVDRRRQGLRPGGSADTDRGRAAGDVLRLARPAVAADAR
jgi:hypothetical protein